MNRRSPVGIIAVLIVGAVAMIAPQVALAQGLGYEVVTQESAVSTNPFKQVEAKCPEGKSALGAEWAMLDGAGAVIKGDVLYFAPEPPGGANWLVDASKLGLTNLPWKLRVQVQCGDARSLAGYRVRFSETSFDATAVKELHLSCASGQKSVSAGWGVLDKTGAIMAGQALEFTPSEDGASWTIQGTPRVEREWKLRGFIVCVDEASLPGYQVVSHEVAPSRDGGRSAAEAAGCPGGKRALSTGWNGSARRICIKAD